MTYYDTIVNPSTFARKASSEQMRNLRMLGQSNDWKQAASAWGREQLFACRVICGEPTRRLPIFADGDHYRAVDPATDHSFIQNVISGPGQNVNLAEMWEPQLVQMFEPDSLGQVWAALAPFFRAETATDGGDGGDDDSSLAAHGRPRRERTSPDRFGPFITSTGYQIGSSPIEDDASSHASSVGFTMAMSAPLVEDATVRLAACFIRNVVNYAQTRYKPSPFIQFRDERQARSYITGGGKKINAIDDGGLQLYDGKLMFQVATLEAKRAFQITDDGKPIVSDRVLAQLVGETLVLRQHVPSPTVAKDDFIAILAVSHYVKFFQFRITDDFLTNFETLSIRDHTSGAQFLRVNSTIWLDLKRADHRYEAVTHLLALLSWADRSGNTVS